jgi:putative alpha-1,2-mannosidase
MTPGLPAWELSTPLFDSVHVRGAIDIAAPGAGPTREYAAAADLGRRTLDRDWLTTDDVLARTRLSYALSATPGGWATTSTPPVIG